MVQSLSCFKRRKNSPVSKVRWKRFQQEFIDGLLTMFGDEKAGRSMKISNFIVVNAKSIKISLLMRFNTSYRRYQQLVDTYR